MVDSLVVVQVAQNERLRVDAGPEDVEVVDGRRGLCDAVDVHHPAEQPDGETARVRSSQTAWDRSSHTELLYGIEKTTMASNTNSMIAGYRAA